MMGAVTAHADTMWELVDEREELEQLGTGFTFTEGPIWHPVEHHLLFSDMPGDVRRRYTPGQGIEEVRRPSNKGNGMTYDAELNLIVCEHVTSSVVREHPDGGRETLASHFDGKELNSPNDVIVAPDGAIWFSDPWYGRMPGFGLERERELGWQGVFRIPPDGGDLELVVDRHELEMPNGLCFSPDHRLLYINDTPNATIKVFDHDASSASLANGRVFADGIGAGVIEEGVVDGMKCDERGHIWVTGPGGVWVFDPDGRHIGTVAVPENVGNLTWGGDDWRTLFLPSSTSLYAMRTQVGPHHEPYMG